MSSTRSEFSAGRRATKPSVDPTLQPADLKNEAFPSRRPSLAKRASRAVVRFLIAFCVGVAATLVWQSYGDAAREMIASSSPRLVWLAPQTAPAAPPAPAAPSPDQEELKAISFGLAAVKQSVDQLAANHEQTMRSVDQLAAGQEQITRTVNQLTVGQEQMTRDITKLQAAEQNILHKFTSTPPARPAAAPDRRPVPPPPPASPVDGGR